MFVLTSLDLRLLLVHSDPLLVLEVSPFYQTDCGNKVGTLWDASPVSIRHGGEYLVSFIFFLAKQNSLIQKH